MSVPPNITYPRNYVTIRRAGRQAGRPGKGEKS